MKIKMVKATKGEGSIGGEFLVMPQSDEDREILERMLTGGVEVTAESLIENQREGIVRYADPGEEGGRPGLKFSASVPLEGRRVAPVKAKKKVSTVE